MAIVDRPDISILDSNWTCIESQVSPEMQHNRDRVFAGRHRVHWKASVPPMGLCMHYIVHGTGQCERSKLAGLKISSSVAKISCPAPYACSKVEGDTVVIQNQHLSVAFDVNLRLLSKVTEKGGSQNDMGEEISMYSSRGGAYLLKPIGNAQPIIQAGGPLVVTAGPLMQEVYTYPKTDWDKAPISYSARVYNGENTIQEFVVEKDYHVELLSGHFDDEELIVRYKTDIENRRIFYTDLNGLQMSRRETYDKIPVQGNYYPMPSLAFMQGLDGL